MRDHQAEIEKQTSRERSIRPSATPQLTPSTPIGPPPGAPKGPSGKPSHFMKPPQGPREREVPPPRPAAHSLVEQEPLLPQMKRKPYLFIAHCYVPVLGTTIPHLKKRMKMYDWREIRVDMTGYFITFDNSKIGEEECVRCYTECNMQALFTYVMNIELHQYGNPNHVRSPSPVKRKEDKRTKDTAEKLRKAEEADYEQEKKARAQVLDPVKGALELLRPQLRDIILGDIKSKIAAPALYDFLDPTRHVAKRRKLNISDPPSNENKPTVGFGRGDLTPFAATPDYKGGYGAHRKPFSRRDPNIRHGRQKDREILRPVNAFLDERRRQTVPKRREAIQPLHRRLANFYESEDESDDENKASNRSEEQDSRSISRMSQTPSRIELEDETRTPKHKRRKVDEAGWGAESDDEVLDAEAKRFLGHLIHKEPEDMAMRELEQVLMTLPRSSKLRQRASAE
ncbi:hypothetical protein LTS18_013601, partial [Coniosporium uncinatum]